MILNPDDKIAIYTVVIGDYDKEIVRSYYKDINADMILFTDNNSKITIPDIDIKYVVKPRNITNAKYSRHIKILTHLYLSNYKYSLYIDGHISIIGNIRELINNNILNSTFTGIAFINHPTRNCLYEEAKFCIKIKKDYKHVIDEQINRYRSEGMPKNNGLIRGGVIFRKHNSPYVISLMNAWYEEVSIGSRRDQLSFNYVSWKLNKKYNRLCSHFYTDYFKQRDYHHYSV